MYSNIEIINHWNWNEKELETLTTEGYTAIQDKVARLPEPLFEKVFDMFDAWLDGKMKKSRFTYWMKKARLTEAEVNIWMTV